MKLNLNLRKILRFPVTCLAWLVAHIHDEYERVKALVSKGRADAEALEAKVKADTSAAEAAAKAAFNPPAK